MTPLLEAAQSETKLKRQGNEWHGPCPDCGGKDRFWIAGGGIAGTGRFACRRCGTSGNAIDFFTRYLGKSKAAACVELGLDAPQDWQKRFWELGEEVVRYTYTAADGTPLNDVVRFECPPDHPLYRTADGKTFRPTTPGGTRYKRPPVPYCLYRLSGVTEAIRAGETVFVCEGEKDADNAAEKLGLVATTNEGGAGKWKREYSGQLNDAHVAIIADNDEAGEEHGQKVADELRGFTAYVRIVRLPDLPPKGDLSDWIAAGGTRDDLEMIVTATPVEAEAASHGFPDARSEVLEEGRSFCPARWYPTWSVKMYAGYGILVSPSASSQ